MNRVFVENIDALSDEVVRLSGKVLLELFEGIDTGLVCVGDGEIRRIGQKDVDRHLVDHLDKAFGFIIGLYLGGHEAPDKAGCGIVALGVADCGDFQIENLVA